MVDHPKVGEGLIKKKLPMCNTFKDKRYLLILVAVTQLFIYLFYLLQTHGPYNYNNGIYIHAYTYNSYLKLIIVTMLSTALKAVKQK